MAALWESAMNMDSDIDASDSSDLSSDEDVTEEIPKCRNLKCIPGYTMLTVEELSDLMKQTVDEVVPVIDLPRHYLRLGLKHFAWEKDRLVEYYYDHGLDELLRMLRLSSPDSLPVTSALALPTSSSLQTDSSSSVFCEICCSSAPPADTFSLSCEHKFCRPCWLSYLREQIFNEGQSNRIPCPAFDCPHLLSDEVALELLQLDAPESSESASSSTMKQRFQKLLALSFVQCNPKLTWCPNATCCYVARLHSNIFQEVLSPTEYVDSTVPHPNRIVCVCGEVFCHRCGQSWHEPLQCAVLDLWLKERREDLEMMRSLNSRNNTKNAREDLQTRAWIAGNMILISRDDPSRQWISENTKNCPKCHVPIEKTGGCNQMTCRNVDCNYKFCWQCLGPWSAHSLWFNCVAQSNMYESRHLSNESTQRRYPVEFARYANHWHSMQLEKEWVRHEGTKESPVWSISWSATKLLKQAVDVLSSCRHVVMYSSVFVHYLEANNQVHIFEENLRDLERATNTLSMCLNRIFIKDVFSELKVQLQNLTQYCEARRVAILMHVYEGYDNGVWIHTVDITCNI